MAGKISKSEGGLVYFSGLAVYAVALYATWKIGILFFLAFVLANVGLWLPFRKNICKYCENTCPFNPNKCQWWGGLP